MRRHFVTRLAALGSFVAFAGCADADTVGGNDTNGLVAAAAAANSAPDGASGNGKASMFGVPREARILFW